MPRDAQFRYPVAVAGGLSRPLENGKALEFFVIARR